MSMSHTQSGATEKLANFAFTCRFDALPKQVVHAARRAFVNIVGCCLGGSHHEMVEIAANSLLPFGGSPTSTVIGRTDRTDVITAAHLNCLSSAALSFDDTHAETILHPSGAVVTALLAVSEHMKMDGSVFIESFVVGVDIASRVSKCVSADPAVGDIGWSQTGIANGLGVAAAVAKALGLDANGIVAAIGIAAVHAAGLRVAHGTMTASLIFANAAQSGIRAALLARNGFEAPVEAIEGRFGFIELFSETPCTDHLVQLLGRRFEVEALAYKPYPCGVVIHPAIDAALEWYRRHGDASDQIEKIELRLHQSAIDLGWRRHPRSSLEAKVSLCHWVAAALRSGRAGVAELQAAAIADPLTVRLRDAIRMIRDEDVSADSAVMYTRSGTNLEDVIKIDHCKGSFSRPLSDSDLNVKFLGQSCGVLSPADAATLLQTCWQIDGLSDVAVVCRLTKNGNAAGTHTPAP